MLFLVLAPPRSPRRTSWNPRGTLVELSWNPGAPWWNPGGTLVEPWWNPCRTLPQVRPGPPRNLSGLRPQSFQLLGKKNQKNTFSATFSFSIMYPLGPYGFSLVMSTAGYFISMAPNFLLSFGSENPTTFHPKPSPNREPHPRPTAPTPTPRNHHRCPFEK